MTIGAAFKAFSGAALFLAVVVAAILPTVGPVDAQPVVRDHRTPSTWPDKPHEHGAQQTQWPHKPHEHGAQQTQWPHKPHDH